MIKLTIIIPVYNEIKTIEKLIKKILKINIKKQLIIVDDGSSDGTFELLTERSKKDQRLKVVRLSKNFGHQAALLADYEMAQGDVIVSLDARFAGPSRIYQDNVG